MSSPDDRSQAPWTDPQTHLDTDPVNAEPAPPAGGDDTGEEDEVAEADPAPGDQTR